MRMDIATPAEMIHFELVDFSDVRKQAYITFLNESSSDITAISGILTLFDEMGYMIEERRVSFAKLRAQSGESFTCHLALDGYPDFVDAEMLVVDVFFANDEPWMLDESRLRDYEPPMLVQGVERMALVSVAGDDAICYPYRDGSNWVCVCGRFNRWRWVSCRRCQRERDEVFALYTPERVMQSHEERREQPQIIPLQNIINERNAQNAPSTPDAEVTPVAPKPKRRRASSAQPIDAPEPPRQPMPDAPPHPSKRKPAAHRRPKFNLAKARGKIITACVCVVIAVLLALGTSNLASKIPGAQNASVAYEIDYLEPIPR